MSELLLIREDGSHAWIPNEYDDIREAIGNWIDLAGGYGPVSAFVDDEGMLTGRRLNVVGSIALGRPLFGPVVLCAREPDDEGETLPPDSRSANAFSHLADIWRTVLEGASRLGQDLTVNAQADTLPPPQFVQMTEAQVKQWLFTGEVPVDE